jgi:hypothetical protein
MNCRKQNLERTLIAPYVKQCGLLLYRARSPSVTTIVWGQFVAFLREYTYVYLTLRILLNYIIVMSIFFLF